MTAPLLSICIATYQGLYVYFTMNQLVDSGRRLETKWTERK